MLRFTCSVATALLLWGISTAASSNEVFSSWRQDEQKFLEASAVFKVDVAPAARGQVSLKGSIADGYYVYRHSVQLLDAEGRKVELELPEGVPKSDEFFGDTQVYVGDRLKLHWGGSTGGAYTLKWQGCAEAGICYPPQEISLTVPVVDRAVAATPRQSKEVGNSRKLPHNEASAEAEVLNEVGAQSLGVGSEPQAASHNQPRSPKGDTTEEFAADQVAAQKLSALGPLAGTMLFFGFGLLLAFTPCTLPMIPIVSTLVVGSQASPRKALLLSLSYVFAMAGTYAVVGVVAGLAGSNIQATLQSPWLLGGFAALFLLLAASLFGAFELKLPSFLVNRLESAGGGRSGGGILGAAGLGLLSALLVGPCMTAPLAGALLYIGQTGSAMYGGVVLFALGLGMGLPLLAIALFGARVLPRPGAWMDKVRVAFGYIMLGMAVYTLARFLPGSANLLLWGMWGMAVAVGLFAWGKSIVAKQRAVWLLRTVALLVGTWSLAAIVGAASGGQSILQPLAHVRGNLEAEPLERTAYVEVKSIVDVDRRVALAKERGQWTLIDFYAEWCVSCHVIEARVFSDPRVADRLSRLQVVRPDVTRNDEDDQALLKRWNVQGPPTLILIGPDGLERRAQRVVGEIGVADFLARLDTAGAP